MRNYMTTTRVDETYSAKYAAMEDTFIKVGEGKGNGDMTETVYRLDPMKKNLIENFLYERENMMLMAKGSMTVDGKSTISDPNTGIKMPIIVVIL